MDMYVKYAIKFSVRICTYSYSAIRRERIHAVHSSKSFCYTVCSKKAACIIPANFPVVTKKLLYKGKIFHGIFMFVFSLDSGPVVQITRDLGFA
jgi:hypothetical protein